MIKAIYKYYLRFPPIAHEAIDTSLAIIIGSIGVDHYHSRSSDILAECTILNKKLFL